MVCLYHHPWRAGLPAMPQQEQGDKLRDRRSLSTKPRARVEAEPSGALRQAWVTCSQWEEQPMGHFWVTLWWPAAASGPRARVLSVSLFQFSERSKVLSRSPQVPRSSVRVG